MKRIKNIKTIAIIGLLILLGIGIAGYYVSNAPKRALEKQVMAMTGMNVNLTFEHAKAYFNGKDSTYKSMPKKKLVVFVDSTSCSGCFIGHLTDYFEINDTLRSHQAELVIVLHPQKARIKEMMSRLHQERFPFWCIADTMEEFLLNNPNLPDNQLLHSFALDEKENIILVGNPARNDRIKRLLYNTILSNN